MEQNNKIKVYTSSLSGNLEISVSGMKQTIEATNNRAKFFSEQSLKYRDEAKKYAEDARYYAEQNSDVSLDDLLNLKSELQKEINQKQDVGNYALKEELPINVSELLNDAKYANETQLLKAVPEQDNHAGKVLYTNGEETSWVGINTFQLFDTKLSDKILTYEDSKGWALQGTYVYKEAIAGSRYGYPDFYAKCLEEYNEATSTETVNGVEIKVHSNGHKFYDIANKDAIDSFFNTMGSAWFYGVDIENERIFLPRNNWFEQASVTDVGQSVEAGLPNITGTVINEYDNLATGQTGAFYHSAVKADDGWGVDANGYAQSIAVHFNASRSNSIYGNSNTVQPNAVKKLLYICVGNTANYEGMTEVVNQGMEMLEQVNQGIESRVNLDATNLSVSGKSLITDYCTPDWSKKVSKSLNTTYTAETGGLLAMQTDGSIVGATIKVNDTTVAFSGTQSRAACACNCIVAKGDTYRFEQVSGAEFQYAYFIPLKGAK